MSDSKSINYTRERNVLAVSNQYEIDSIMLHMNQQMNQW